MRLGKSQREKDVTEVVSVIVFGKDDKILMGLRGDTGKWCLPGGHAEPGENLLEAAKRELLEETGLSSEGMERLGWCDVRDGLRVHTFVCRATGTPDAGGDPDEEMVAFKWLSADNLPKSVAENLHNKKDVSLQFLDAQERSLDLVWDEDGAGDHEGRKKLRKTELKKMGAMARLAPFNPANPDDRLDPGSEQNIARWQGADREMEDRESSGFMGQAARMRALHNLASETTVRRHPVTGAREFLLHRGMGPEEHKWITDRGQITHPDVVAGRQPHDLFVNHKGDTSSWTPRYSMAQNFAKEYRLDNGLMLKDPGAKSHVVSAWVPEHTIRMIPKQYGKLDPYSELNQDEPGPLPLGHNDYGAEHEVIVGPGHNSQIATPGEVQAAANPKTTLHGRINAVNSPLRTRLKYRGFGQLGKFETDLGTWLAKATRPEDFKQIARAITPEGPRFVDHRGQLSAHPAAHNPDVEAYRRHVLDSPGVNTKAKGKSEGVTRKVVFKTVGKPQSDLFAGQAPDDARYMVKPYHEGIVRRISSWQKHPIQGWAEMTNQALYHAGGIGHLHQNVHVAEHNMGPGHEHEPALVVKMAPGMMPIYGHPSMPSELARIDARKIGLMDLLTNNLDRHGGNLLMDRQGQKVMAIDHSRSFQYVNNHSHKWDSQAKVKKENNFEDSFGPYIGRSVSSVGQVDPYENNSYDSNMNRLKNYAPVMDWWGENSSKIRAAMDQQLEHIKDPDVKAHIRRNFDARAKWLDERAKFGLENYGTDWHRDPVVQYHPHQRSDDEIEAEKLAQLRAQP